MERLREILRREKKDELGFLRELLETLISEEDVYSDELLFRDAVEEIYGTLKGLVFEEGRRDLISAYEDAVLLRSLVAGKVKEPRELMEDMIKKLGA
ncbi:hypothetical protein [Thermococcus sp.]